MSCDNESEETEDAPHVEVTADSILEKARDVFGSNDAAAEWLRKRALALGGQTPVEFLMTAEGRRELELLLIRLDYGVFT